jgi:hypothetical protein
VKSVAVRTESLKEIVEVDPVKTMDSAPESTVPETFINAPATTALEPETEVPPRLVSVTVAGVEPVVMETELDVYPASVAISPVAARVSVDVTGTAAMMIV